MEMQHAVLLPSNSEFPDIHIADGGEEVPRHGVQEMAAFHGDFGEEICSANRE